MLHSTTMDTSHKTKLIVIVGTTASGKTNLAIELAKKYSGEVISADSRQVYRGLDIGTAKVTEEEKQGIPHHLLDVAEPNSVYTAADFKRDATEAIDSINERDHLPIIAGGTFFYIDVLLNRVSLPAVPPNPELRQELEQKSTEDLYQKLVQLDPTRATAIDTSNRRRLIRALEVAHSLGTNPPPTNETEPPHKVLWLGIERSKEELRERYRARAIAWLDGSFAAEVTNLLEKGLSRERLEEIGFEYRLMLDYLDRKLTDEEFITRAIEKNWQYAKRQLTWLKRNQEIIWKPQGDIKAVEVLVDQFLSS